MRLQSPGAPPSGDSGRATDPADIADGWRRPGETLLGFSRPGVHARQPVSIADAGKHETVALVQRTLGPRVVVNAVPGEPGDGRR